jgi:hypothetical protein
VDENRTVNALRDELGLEIERVLAVDPAPDLKARVRIRIDHERTAQAWWMPWRLVGAGTLAVAGVVALILSAPERQVDQVSLTAQPSSVATADSTPAAVAAPEPLQPVARVPVARGRRSSRQSAAVRQMMGAPVLTSAREAAALRLLVANIRDGSIDPDVLSQVQPVGKPLPPLAEIAIQPITIEPLARQELLEGAPQ